MNLFEKQCKRDIAEQEAAAAEIKAHEAVHGAPQERGRGGMTHYNRDDEAAAIEERRKQVQIAEQSKPFTTNPHATSGEPWPFKSPEEKPLRPTDKQLVEAIASFYSVSYGTACDWILEVAENLRAAA